MHKIFRAFEIVYGVFLGWWVFNAYIFIFENALPFLGHLHVAIDSSRKLEAFQQAVAEVGYLYPLIHIIQILLSLALILGKFRPLMLLAFFPIVVNILLLSIWTNPGGIVLAVVISVTHCVLLLRHYHHYSKIFKPQ